MGGPDLETSGSRLASHREVTTAFRIGVSGSWELHTMGQGSSISSARGGLGCLQCADLSKTRTEDTQGEHAKCRTNHIPGVRVSTEFSHVWYDAAIPATSLHETLRVAIKASLAKNFV